MKMKKKEEEEEEKEEEEEEEGRRKKEVPTEMMRWKNMNMKSYKKMST